MSLAEPWAASLSSFARSHRLRRSKGRGFTMVELLVVVVIIAILAVIAVPTMTERMRERRSAEAAQSIAALYRGARLRAMGRGAAVRVEFKNSRFRVFEAVRKTEACNEIPSPRCADTTLVDAPIVTSLSLGRFPGVTVTGTDFDICYSPMGSTFKAAVPMVGVETLSVSRGAGSLTRVVNILPNGIARLAL